MTWDDFFFDERFVRVHSAEKNRDIPWRDIPVDDDSAWDLFASWRDEDTAQGILFVISYCGKPIKRFTGAWRRTLKRAGIKRKLPPYSLRHSFVTELLKSGADLKTTSEMAGHSDVGTTVRIYQHTTELMRKQAARKLPTIPVDANDEAPKKKTEDSRYTGEVYKSPKNDPLLYTSKNKLQ